MFWYKLRMGGHLFSFILWGNITSALWGFSRSPFGVIQEIRRAVWQVWQAILTVVRMQGKPRVVRLVELCLASGVSRARLATNPESAYILAEQLNSLQKHEEVIELIGPLLRNGSKRHKCLAARGMAYLGIGRYPEALADLTRCHELRPQFARDFQYNLYRAYLHGLRGETEAAREAMAAQMVGEGRTGTAEESLAAFLATRLGASLAPLNLRGSTGVVIGCFNTAVGHAILDPFHFIQLFRSRFDNLILVHPPYNQYSPATRLSAYILDQYVEQVEISDHDTLNFAWQSLGELRHENLTFLVHHYWSLNRLAYQARTDATHPMSSGRNYLTLPVKLAARAEAILRRNNIDLSRPLVVVHTREHGYHGLRGQRYRNTDARNYVPALRRLTELGYQVVRIGDRKMTSVRRDVPGLLELPGTDYYDPVLDPYFISRCRFMISCQSGPCSYARVFGKPNLVVNAVYHYTLLPERNELLAFKLYRKVKSKRAMTLEEIFRAGAHLFDRTEHFEDAGIDVEDMTPAEILAATEEMVAWLDDPDRPESAEQVEFRRLMAWFASHPDESHQLAHPLTDYIGYALPECRLSEAVCQLRPGYLATTAVNVGEYPELSIKAA